MSIILFVHWQVLKELRFSFGLFSTAASPDLPQIFCISVAEYALGEKAWDISSAHRVLWTFWKTAGGLSQPMRQQRGKCHSRQRSAFWFLYNVGTRQDYHYVYVQSFKNWLYTLPCFASDHLLLSLIFSGKFIRKNKEWRGSRSQKKYQDF